MLVSRMSKKLGEMIESEKLSYFLRQIFKLVRYLLSAYSRTIKFSADFPVAIQLVTHRESSLSSVNHP